MNQTLDWEMVRCTACLEQIPALATKCRFCGTVNESALALRRLHGAKDHEARSGNGADPWRAKMQEFRLELTHIPYDLRRKFKVAEWVLAHPWFGIPVAGLFALLFSVAFGETVAMFIPAEWGIARWVQYGVNVITFVVCYSWFERGVYKLFSLGFDYLMKTKKEMIQEGERQRELKEAHVRRKAAEAKLLHKGHSHGGSNTHAVLHSHGPAVEHGRHPKRAAEIPPLPDFGSRPKVEC